MKRFPICLALLVSVLPALAQGYLPRDVQRFVDRRQDCDHIRRIQEVPREIGNSCAGTDKELAQLKRKYAANSTIMQLLNQFETAIEVAEVRARK